jgi:hypothetical protein
VGGGGKTAPFDREEAVSGNTERSVVMESSPAAAFIMLTMGADAWSALSRISRPFCLRSWPTQFLLQLFVVALDDPAVFG